MLCRLMPPKSESDVIHLLSSTQLAYVVNTAAVQFCLTDVQVFGRQQTQNVGQGVTLQ